MSVGGMGEGDSSEGGEGNKDRRKREGIVLVMSKTIIRERIVLLTIYQKIKKISNTLKSANKYTYTV